MTCVWLAEMAWAGDREPYGIFSDAEKARQVCQDAASEYFGPSHTETLVWQDGEEFSTASYHHPARGMKVFMVTRFEVDKVIGR